MASTIDIDEKAIDQDGRFSRFELISWWDQEKLKNAKVLVVGAGALGNEIIKNLALIGVGNILVVDMDRIENSNLSRSVLFRESDNGRMKAAVAAEAATKIYPETNIYSFCGNVVHAMGLGAYFWADIIIGGLDNREARVAINSGAAFAGKLWIDGAIEVLNGVARVFDAESGPCYECTMSEVDWKVLENRRSCALLSREEMVEGKVPTTPTTASIVAGIQVQEAIKALHGMETIAGKGLVYSGLTGEQYVVEYPRKKECYGHDRHTCLEVLEAGVGDITVGDLLKKARNHFGDDDAVVGLSRDIISALSCPKCGSREQTARALGTVSEKDATCPDCGETRTPELLMTLGIEAGLEDKTLEEIGVPYYDVVTARSGDDSISYLFGGDAERMLGKLSR